MNYSEYEEYIPHEHSGAEFLMFMFRNIMGEQPRLFR